MQTIEQTYNASETKTFAIPGRYFRLMGTTGPVDVAFYRNNSHLGDALQVEAGFSWAARADKNDSLFDRVQITTSTGQTIKFAVSDFEIRYDRSAGSVDIKSTAVGRAFSHTGPACVPASGQLLAANASRRFLMIQNNDASATVWLNLNGGAASIGNGLKLAPGASAVFDVVAPVGAVFGYSDSVIVAGLLAFVEA